MLIGGSVKVALRLRDESVGADPPFFKSADSNPTSAAARSGIGARQGPTVNSTTAVDEQAVHRYFQIRESGHETGDKLSDGTPSNRRFGIVHAERATR